jgi:hypothetical protein
MEVTRPSASRSVKATARMVMRELRSYGQVGSTSRVVLQMGKQTIEGTETITRREPVDLREIPRESVVRFEREIVIEGMWNAVRDRLTEAGPETTLWESENEYRFSSLLMRLMAC